MKDGFLRLWHLVRDRVVTFYLIVCITSFCLVDYEKVILHARNESLSRLIPAFEYFCSLVHGHEAVVDREKLKEYASYFETLVEYLPAPDVYGTLGYIYFNVGKDRKAVYCFKKAVAVAPQVFNFNYNLGVIYFNRHFYKEAIEFLEKAVNTSIEVNLNYITSSRVYFPFLGSQDDITYRLKVYLKDGFRNAYRLLISSCLYQEDYHGMLSYATAGISAALDEEKDFYYFAGLAAFNLRKFEQAGAFLKEYINVHPNDSSALYFMGLTLQALGDDRSAGMILEKAKGVNGDGVEKIGKNAIALHVF